MKKRKGQPVRRKKAQTQAEILQKEVNSIISDIKNSRDVYPNSFQMINDLGTEQYVAQLLKTVAYQNCTLRRAMNIIEGND